MNVRLVLVGLIAGLTSFVGMTAIAVAGPDGSDNGTMCVLNTKLAPENEVRTTPNTSVASGHAQVKVRNDGTTELKSFVMNPAGEVFNRAHIHGPAGTTANAGIVIDFLEAGVPVASLSDETITFMADGRPRSTTPANIGELLCANPQLYYLNFHSTAELGGAIRGQLG